MRVTLEIRVSKSPLVSFPDECDIPRKSQTTPRWARVVFNVHTALSSGSNRPPRHSRHRASPVRAAMVVAEQSSH